jgi:hypothetical protein
MSSTHNRVRRGLFWWSALLLPISIACSSATQPSSATPPPVTTATAGTGAAPTTASAAVTRSPNSLVAPSPAVIASSAAPSPVAAAPSSDNLLTAVRTVSQRVKPAVVQITNQQEVQVSQFNQPFVVPAGVGSGVIYDSQGHILTNNHVIEGAQQILVSLPDKRSFPGKVVGSDPQTDLAVLQIHGDNLPVAQLGDSGQLQVGDWVVAIGNALALPGGPTVTQGVVSALGRTVQEPGAPASPGSQSQSAGPFLFDVIQTDAPINSRKLRRAAGQPTGTGGRHQHAGCGLGGAGCPSPGHRLRHLHRHGRADSRSARSDRPDRPPVYRHPVRTAEPRLGCQARSPGPGRHGGRPSRAGITGRSGRTPAARHHHRHRRPAPPGRVGTCGSDQRS